MPDIWGRLIAVLIQWRRPIAAAGGLILIAAMVGGLVVLDRYIRGSTGPKTGPLVLEDIPAWVDRSPDLRQKIVKAAGGVRLALSEDLARRLAAGLAEIAWLDRVQVRLTPKDVRVKAVWRRPAAIVEIAGSHFYVDKDQVLLDFVQIPGLDLKRIDGIHLSGTPRIGQPLASEDLREGLEILALLESMDMLTSPVRPLLTEIDSVDVSNYMGRLDKKAPHIVIYAKDRTQIIWGAEVGSAARYLEADEHEKLARLYSFYKESGTLMGLVKYVDLRPPQYQVPTPMDRYRITAH